MFENYSMFRAMCLIDFGLPVEQDEGDMLNKQDSRSGNLQYFSVKKGTKRKFEVLPIDKPVRRNFQVLPLENPVLFLAHTSKNSLFIVDKPWLQVVKSLEAPPVHRHIYGT